MTPSTLMYLRPMESGTDTGCVITILKVALVCSEKLLTRTLKFALIIRTHRHPDLETADSTFEGRISYEDLIACKDLHSEIAKVLGSLPAVFTADVDDAPVSDTDNDIYD